MTSLCLASYLINTCDVLFYGDTRQVDRKESLLLSTSFFFKVDKAAIDAGFMSDSCG